MVNVNELIKRLKDFDGEAKIVLIRYGDSSERDLEQVDIEGEYEDGVNTEVSIHC